MSRLNTLLEAQRQKNKNLLFVDNGGFFPAPKDENQKLTAQVGLKVMSHMGLDVMNLGKAEFTLGVDYLAAKAKEVSFPFISTNITSEVELPWLNKYVIKTFDESRVAILGILPEDAFDDDNAPAFVKDLTIVNPKSAVQKVLKELEGRVDAVILLSQLKDSETKKLVEGIPAITLAVTRSPEIECHMTDTPGQIVAPTGAKGIFFLSGSILMDTAEKAKFEQAPSVEMVRAIEETKSISKMITKPFFAAKHASNSVVLKQASPEQMAEFQKKLAEQSQEKELPPSDAPKMKLFIKGKEVPASITIKRGAAYQKIQEEKKAAQSSGGKE